jgi:maleylacetoacetate isomerase
MKLYDYYRSTACYRVRIALHVKNIPFDIETIHLVNQGGEQHSDYYKAINPQGLVPSLEVADGTISQSLAIIAYLEETYPTPALLPSKAIERAQVRSLALLVACDMHPLNNLRVLNQLKSQFKASEEDTMEWYHHWLKRGFDSIEAYLSKQNNKANFCFGNSISLADVCLIPQVFNANRFHFAMDNYPKIQAINAHCLSLEAFQKALPQDPG